MLLVNWSIYGDIAVSFFSFIDLLFLVLRIWFLLFDSIQKCIRIEGRKVIQNLDRRAKIGCSFGSAFVVDDADIIVVDNVIIIVVVVAVVIIAVVIIALVIIAAVAAVVDDDDVVIGHRKGAGVEGGRGREEAFGERGRSRVRMILIGALAANIGTAGSCESCVCAGDGR